MIHPRIDELLDTDGVDSRYALVIVAAKRARQINNYHHQLGEGMLRRSAAAARRVALEELLDDVPGRNRPGQDQVRVQGLARSRLDGVSPSCSAAAQAQWCAMAARSSSGSPAASPPTRPASSCACSSTRGTRCCRCVDAAAPSASSPRETFYALARSRGAADPYPHLDARRPARDRAADREHAREARARARRQRPHRGRARAPTGRCSSRRR